MNTIGHDHFLDAVGVANLKPQFGDGETLNPIKTFIEMKKNNRKQRAEIYLKVAEGIAINNGYSCLRLRRLANTKIPYERAIPKFFPEYADILNDRGSFIGEGVDDNLQDFRILALLFAAEMAKNPIK